MKDESLLFERHIASSDDDLEIGADITVGFNDDKNFVIILAPWDYAGVGANRWCQAIVEKEEALVLASKLRVNLTELPDTFQSKFNNSHLSDMMVTWEVEAIFKEILDFLLKYNIKYKLEYKKRR